MRSYLEAWFSEAVKAKGETMVASVTVVPPPLGPGLWDVTSSTSGTTYRVRLDLKNDTPGWAVCQCNYGERSMSLLPTCSHVWAVLVFTGAVECATLVPRAAAPSAAITQQER
jgi:hypothetical protein